MPKHKTPKQNVPFNTASSSSSVVQSTNNIIMEFIPKQDYLILQTENQQLRAQVISLGETVDKLHHFQIENMSLLDTIERLKKENQELKDKVTKLELEILEDKARITKLEINETFRLLVSGIRDIDTTWNFEESAVSLDSETREILISEFREGRNGMSHFITKRDKPTTKNIKCVAICKALQHMNSELAEKFDDFVGKKFIADIGECLKDLITRCPKMNNIQDTDPELVKYMKILTN